MTETLTSETTLAPATAARTRVAIVGATGYAGQELVRLLARHPRATLTLATASQATSTPRKLPALARIWEGEVTPLDLAAVQAEADVAFLALPEAASAELAPPLLDAGLARRRSVGRVSPSRRGGADRRWYPATTSDAGGRRVRADRVRAGRDHGRAPRRQSRVLSDGVAAGAVAAGQQRDSSPPAGDVVIDAKSGISGAGKAPTERTHFSENHGSVAAYGAFGHRHTPEMEQALGRQVTFVPHLVPLDRGLLSSMYRASRAGHDRRTGGGGVRAHVCQRAVRPAHRHDAAGDQARGVDQLLRHRLEGRRGDGPRRWWCR